MHKYKGSVQPVIIMQGGAKKLKVAMLVPRTEKDASASIWYLAAMPKRVLLLPAVQARLTPVSSLSFTFW